MGKCSRHFSDSPASMMAFLGMCDEKKSANSELCNGSSLHLSMEDLKKKNLEGPTANGNVLEHEIKVNGRINQSDNNVGTTSVPDIQISTSHGQENGSCYNRSDLQMSKSSNREASMPASTSSALDDTMKHEDLTATLSQELEKNSNHIPHSSQMEKNTNEDVEHYVNPRMNTTHTSSLINDIPVEVGSSAGFSNVIENLSLPLLYIPTTKQLIAGKEEMLRDLDLSPANERSKLTEQLSPTSNNSSMGESSLATTTLIHRAHSTGDFELPGRLADLDHITVHSVDSLPCSSHLFEPSSSMFCDTSSLSSVSTNTDFSISAMSAAGGEEPVNAEAQSLSHVVADESLFMDVNLHSRNSFDLGAPTSSSIDIGISHLRGSHAQEPKKKPLAFSGLKSLFTKRTKEQSPPGWKLFGKVPPKTTPHRDPQEITSEFQARQKKSVAKTSFETTAPPKRHNTEVMSTTALILENRPINLPSKTKEEEEKHKQQYEEMIEAAKKKEQKDIKLKKKQLQQQRKVEDQLMTAAQIWNIEILPNWDSMRSSKKARGLWWLGLPPSVRGKVWKLAIGNDLNITHELYEICHERAEDRIKLMQAESSLSSSSSEVVLAQIATNSSNKESSVKVIKLDVSRTFPQLCIFQKGGPYYELLHSLLGAYACYRPDVGYVQGMSFIAAILLLNMDVADAFVCFTNLLNRPCQMAFFRMDEHMMSVYYRTFEDFFKENLPKLHDHFKSYSVTPNLYLMEWVFLLYSKSLPLDVACRVWDIFCRDGEEFLFRTAIGILKLYECVLLQMDFIHIAQYLTKLPENISADQLFKMVDSVCMTLDKRGFNSVHSSYKDLVDSGSLAS